MAENVGENLENSIKDATEGTGGLVEGLEEVTEKTNEAVKEISNFSDFVGQSVSAVGFLGKGFFALAESIGLAKAASFLFAKTYMDIEDSVTEVVAGFGQTRYFSDAMQNTLVAANMELYEFGITLDEQEKSIAGFNSELNRMNLLTSQEVVRMNILAKATGLSGEEMAQMVAQMSDLGMGTLTAIQSVEKMAVEAQRLGLNVKEFITEIGDNIKLVNQYGFDKGINGLAKMVAKAQALRFDIQQSVNIADTILDGGPEKAVELAAELATLGGDIGEFSDPYALMFNSLNDVGAIQDSLIDLASAAASVNQETGQIEIPPEARFRLRQQAKMMGLDIDELSKAAVNSKRQMMALEEIEFSGLAGMSDEDKQFIANISEINEKGELVVKLKEGTETREIQLTDEAGITQAMNELKEQQAEATMDPQDILRANTLEMKSLNDTLKILTSKEALLKVAAGAFDSKEVEKVLGGLKNSVNDVTQSISQTALNVKELFNQEEVTGEDIKGLINKTIVLFQEDLTNFGDHLELPEESTKGFRDALDSLTKYITEKVFPERNTLGGEIDKNDTTKDLGAEINKTNTTTGLGAEINKGITVPSQEMNNLLIQKPNESTQTTTQPSNNFQPIMEKQSAVLETIQQNTTYTQKQEQSVSIKDMNVNVSGSISLTDRNGNVVDILRNNPDVKNQIVMIVNDAFKRGYEPYTVV